jgi:hypothetical protein
LEKYLEHKGVNIAKKILNTSLFTSICEERRIWKAEENGVYSVRSAYRFCITDFIDTSSFRAAGSWNLIWRIKAPPKINLNKKRQKTILNLNYKYVCRTFAS